MSPLLDRPFMVLVRRELWEHRSLIWAPLAMAAAIIMLSALSGAIHGGFQIDLREGSDLPGIVQDPGKQRGLFAALIAGLVLPQLLVGFAVAAWYLLDCLFTERRDRSILFWKSLPVSDAKTVLSKLFVVLVAMPLWIWALSLVVGLAVFAVLSAKVSGTPAAALGVWHGGIWLQVQASMLGKLLLSSLWYLPVAGWLLLVSAFAKRAPILWATLPYLAIGVVEATVFRSDRVVEYLNERLFGYDFGFFSLSNAAQQGAGTLAGLPGRLADFGLLASPDLWLGVLVGAALVYAAIRVRQRSDDS
jgi:ABC-2 type transport system permease protein